MSSGMIGGLIGGGGGDATGIDSSVLWQEDPRMYVDDAETDLLRMVGAAEGRRGVVSNNNTYPWMTNNLAAGRSLVWGRVRKTVALNGNWSSIFSVIPNAILNVVNYGHGQYPYAKYIATLEYNGAIYPLTFSGERWGYATNNSYIVSDVIKDLVLPPGARYFINIYMVIDKVSTGSTPFLTSYQNVETLGEGAGTGVFTGIDPDTDVRLVNYGRGWTGAATVSGGNITGIVEVTPGNNYGNSANLNLYAAETGPDGKLYSKKVGTYNSAATIANGGNPTGFVITSGTPPTGLPAWVNPEIIAGTPNVSGGTQGFGSSFEFGVCDNPNAKSLVIIGDSVAAQSQDGVGNIIRSKNNVERPLKGRCGVLNFASQGSSAHDYVDLSRYAGMWDFITTFKDYITHAISDFGSNDIVVGFSAASVASIQTTMRGYFNSVGIKCAFTTLLPRLAVGSPLTPESAQINATGFAAGGEADIYNEMVRSGSLVSDWGYGDPRLVLQGVDPNKWRDDFEVTGDGVHNSDSGTRVGYALVESDPALQAFYSQLS